MPVAQTWEKLGSLVTRLETWLFSTWGPRYQHVAPSAGGSSSVQPAGRGRRSMDDLRRIFMGRLGSGTVTCAHNPLPRTSFHAASDCRGLWNSYSCVPGDWRTWIVSNLGHTKFWYYRILGNSSDNTYLSFKTHVRVIYSFKSNLLNSGLALGARDTAVRRLLSPPWCSREGRESTARNHTGRHFERENAGPVGAQVNHEGLRKRCAHWPLGGRCGVWCVGFRMGQCGWGLGEEEHYRKESPTSSWCWCGSTGAQSLLPLSPPVFIAPFSFPQVSVKIGPPAR